jgi:glucose/arabinose dehydrogenase
MIPEWKNNLFVSSLAGQHISRLVIENNKVVGEERLLLNNKQRIRDLAEGPDGALYAITDADNGRLLRIGKTAN